MKRAISVLALALILGACATYNLVTAQRTAIGDLYTVESRIPWNSARKGSVEIWTVDGPSLQAIRFVKGLEHDEALFKGKDEQKSPKFKKHMTPTAIAELVVDGFTMLGAQKVDTTNLRPEKFGAVQGFRFELEFVSREGLEGRGFALGAVVEERLHLIIYTGLSAHYYSKQKSEVEQIIESIRMQ